MLARCDISKQCFIMAATAGCATRAKQKKVFASFFKKKAYCLLCFFEKKHQKTFVCSGVHRQPRILPWCHAGA